MQARTPSSTAVGHRQKRRRGKGRLSGKTRFRALVRLVMEHRSWLQENLVIKKMDDDIIKNVLKIELITREKYQSLTLENKSLLRKDARLRTEDDIENLYRVIGNLKCFRRYPENVRKELVAATYFEYYGAERVIVRQDHHSTFLGFLLRGELEVTVTKLDPVFGNWVTESTGHLLPGAMFGDVSLLHNIPRTATVTSTSAVELLILKKDDFERVLKASMQKQWDDISSALKQFPYFEDWNEVATRECCMLSDTMSFNTHDIILGKGIGKATSAHFVLSGTISMVQRLMIIRNTSDGSIKLHAANALPSSDAEPIFMQVCLFNQGGSFNVGESLTGRTVVAESDVKVLRIPLYLLRQHNTANIWHRIRQFLESRLPTEPQLFSRFLEARRWDRHRKALCATLRNPETLNDTTVHDAPYYWRVLDLEMCGARPCDPNLK